MFVQTKYIRSDCIPRCRRVQRSQVERSLISGAIVHGYSSLHGDVYMTGGNREKLTLKDGLDLFLHYVPSITT